MDLKDEVRYGVARLRNAYNNHTGKGFTGRDLGVLRQLQKQGRVTLGRGTYGVPTLFTHILDTTGLRVGNYCSLAGTYILGGGHPPDRVTTYPIRIMTRMEGFGEDGFPQKVGDTVIGSDCYVGWGCMLLSSVKIGDGAIVGSGALVTKDVPPYAIVGGNPAKVIRYRYDEAQIDALLEIKWWDWPEEEIKAAADLLSGDDVDAFIAYAQEHFPSPVSSAD